MISSTSTRPSLPRRYIPSRPETTRANYARRQNTLSRTVGLRWTTIYLSFMWAVLRQCHRLLKKSGSIFLHCDRSASHHLRLLLDETFGADHFQSEIIWAYKRWSSAKKGLQNAHQTIYFYSVSDSFKFNTLYTEYSPTTNIDQILQVAGGYSFSAVGTGNSLESVRRWVAWPPCGRYERA